MINKFVEKLVEMGISPSDLMCMVASCKEDVYLRGQPQITFWRLNSTKNFDRRRSKRRQHQRNKSEMGPQITYWRSRHECQREKPMYHVLAKKKSKLVIG